MAAALALDVIGRTVARVSAVKKGETKEVTLAIAFSEKGGADGVR